MESKLSVIHAVLTSLGVSRLENEPVDGPWQLLKIRILRAPASNGNGNGHNGSYDKGESDAGMLFFPGGFLGYFDVLTQPPAGKNFEQVAQELQVELAKRFEVNGEPVVQIAWTSSDDASRIRYLEVPKWSDRAQRLWYSQKGMRSPSVTHTASEAAHASGVNGNGHLLQPALS